MRKAIVLYSTILVLLSSCDPPADYDYYITNQCDEEIIVFYKTKRQDGRDEGPHKIVIPPYETILIYDGHWIGKVEDRMIEWFFQAIIIHKGDEISKVNYVNVYLWEFAPTSKRHANSFLVVTQEVFDGRPRRQWEHETP